jgi:hypothetical protein
MSQGRGQWSEDRQWWWDGQQWVPAAQAPTGPPNASQSPSGTTEPTVKPGLWQRFKALPPNQRNLYGIVAVLTSLMLLAGVVAVVSGPRFQQGYQAGVAAPTPAQLLRPATR